MRRETRCFSSLGILLAVGCARLAVMPAMAQQVASLEGRVRADDGRVIPSGVMIRVETLDGEIAAAAPPSSDGQFAIGELPKVVVRVTVTAEGFQPYQENVDLGRGGGRIQVNVFLSPLRKISAPAESAARSDEAAPKLARQEYEKGAQAMAKKKLDEAQRHLERAVAEYPCYARALTDEGLIFSTRQDGARAEAALRKALECDSDFPLPYEILGELLNAQKKFADAEKVLLEGVRRAPASWQFYYQLAAAHRGLGQDDTAVAEYLKVQSLSPHPPVESFVKLADLYTRQHKYDEAYAQMQAYLRADPEGRFAAKIKKIMGEMESSGVLRASRSTPPPQPGPQKH